MKRSILILAALLFSCAGALGRSTSFPLTMDIRRLCFLAERYHAEVGVYPESWAEVEGRFGPIKTLNGLDHLERFAFMREKVAVPYPTDGHILFISREPFRPPATRDYPVFQGYYKTVGPLGYTAAIAYGDEIDLRHISPQRAAQLFEQAGVSLPAPSGLGLYPHERAHRSKVIAWWIGLAVVGGLIIRALFKRWKDRSGENARPVA